MLNVDKSLGILLLVRFINPLDMCFVCSLWLPGGSTIVLLFEKGAVEWDEDLLINGRASLETLVRVGMGIGSGRRGAASSPAP
jgi:hypothetical protein